MMVRIDSLISPYGIVSSARPRAAEWRGLREMQTAAATSGAKGDGGDMVVGGGRSFESADHARLVAVAEAVERYCGADVVGEERIVASALDLGDTALSFERFPRCSPREYARSGCPVSAFDPAAPIRWIRGLELTRGEPLWVPAVMAAYSYAHVTPAERFTYRISTGYSVHSDPVEATVGGIAEVVERDAIALLWLQRLRLPELRPDVRSSRLTTLIGWAERHFLRIHLYDATTDLGVPTVWVLVVSDHDDERRHVAGCATGRTLVAAAEKAAAEAIAVRGVLHSDDPIPDDFADYTTIRDGARFMGRAEQSDAFDFLRPGPDREAGRCPAAAALPADPDAALAALIGIFARRDMPVVVVDRTPGEVAAAGLVCVSVVIPDLQPMSLRPLAQFTAHPRLYDAPARMGYPVLSETELNPWPLPFA